MDPSLRNTPALIAKIDRHRMDFIKHYQELLVLIGTKNPSRTTSAILQYQIQVETANLIRTGEELQLMIRQMQELWLFGQLDTLGESEVQARTDESARVVGELLRKVMDGRRDGESQDDSGGGGRENGEGAMAVAEGNSS